MINKKRLGALLAAGTMIVGMNITAFAQDPKAIPNVGTGTENAPAVVSVTKDFEMAEGLSIPSVTFNFAAAKVTPDAPDAAIQPIQYSSADAKGNADIIGRHRTGYSGTEIFNASSCNRRQPYIEGSS